MVIDVCPNCYEFIDECCCLDDDEELDEMYDE